MVLDPTTCLVCETRKGEANKWLVGWEAAHGYAIADWPTEEQGARLPYVVATFCGEKCALTHQAKYLRRQG